MFNWVVELTTLTSSLTWTEIDGPRPITLLPAILWRPGWHQILWCPRSSAWWLEAEVEMVIEDLISPQRVLSELPTQREVQFRTEFWKHPRIQLVTYMESLLWYEMSHEMMFTLRMLSLQHSQFQILRNQLCWVVLRPTLSPSTDAQAHNYFGLLIWGKWCLDSWSATRRFGNPLDHF